MSVEAMRSDVFRIEIPSPSNHLKPSYAYFIRGHDRSLLIDTGFNHTVCRQALLDALHDLNADLENTDIFVTHMHADHSGLITHLKVPGNTVYMGEADGKIVANGTSDPQWDTYREFFIGNGFGTIEDTTHHVGYRYASPPVDGIVFVPDGYQFHVGQYRLNCIITKGHTDGHMCLYEPDRHILFSGDHILPMTKPVIMRFDLNEGNDTIADYFVALDLVDALDVDIVYPGHSVVSGECHEVIAETRAYHKGRLNDIIGIIGKERKSPIDIARTMTWGFTGREWDHYAGEIKLLMLSELYADLYHLIAQGILIAEKQGEQILLRKKG
jgi:glyoxylase-like metal-dependent hydrolase (beta-lactamase superfamily II)